MNNYLTVVFLACFVAVMSAQGAQRTTLGPKPSTITGCVAQSGSVYRIDHAMVGTDPDVDTQNRPSTEANPTPKMVSYVLMGADVKAHVGHRVEVTGTISSDTKSKDVADVKALPGMKVAGRLNVKSVKMISATCP